MTKNRFSLINIQATFKDLLGLGAAKDGIGKAAVRLGDAIAKGVGAIADPTRTALQAVADHFSRRQETSARVGATTALVAAIQKLPLDPDFKESATRYVAMRELLGQSNRENVARAAAQIFIEEATERDVRKPKSLDDEERTLDPDWLNQFWEYASKKSHPDLQAIFGKILAQTAYTPGAISPATLHTLSILDKDGAESIEKICSLSVRHIESGACFLLDPSTPNKKGLDYFDWDIFQEHFDRAEQLGVLVRTQHIAFDKRDHGSELEIGGKHYRVILPKTYKSDLYNIPLSAIGRDFRRLLQMKAPPNYIAALVFFLSKRKIKLETPKTSTLI